MSSHDHSLAPAAARALASIGLIVSFILAGCSDENSSDTTDPQPDPIEDRSYYVLPPGNYGGLPTSQNSLDQLPLYDGLTPLRGDVTDADIERFYLPQDFQPVGETVEEATGRPGTTILYDEYGIPHISGETREDLAFGAGWVTARDRIFLLNLGRYTARAAVADIPNIDAFELLLTGQSFVPSAATEQLVTDQVELLVEVYGDEGRQIIADAQAYVDGGNAYLEANGGNPAPYTVNDVVAINAFIGSIFGAGGGAEAANAEFLSRLRQGLGDGRAQQAWEDVMLFDDPEAPTTLDRRTPDLCSCRAGKVQATWVSQWPYGPRARRAAEMFSIGFPERRTKAAHLARQPTSRTA